MQNYRLASSLHYCADESSLAREYFHSSIDHSSENHIPDIPFTELHEMVSAMHADKDWFVEILHQYRLSTKEGVLLMSLAEALLRIPDEASSQALFNDRIHRGDWLEHDNENRWNQLFAHALHWLSERSEHEERTQGFIDRLGQKSAIEICTVFIRQMSSRFVFGETLEEALIRSRQLEPHESCSFDMLGEAALTYDEADEYYQAYLNAIEEIGCYNQCLDDTPHEISIKLSALHPRYEPAKADLLKQELLPRLVTLCLAAEDACVHITIDAEEQYRLDLSLMLIAELITHPELTQMSGLGIAVQAYGKRAPDVIEHISDLAQSHNKHMTVRLVKGAYWDYEIKRAQQLGLNDYPVWTEKALTDASYISCARALLDAHEYIHAEFATHNPETLLQLDQLNRASGETLVLQRLHGMGDTQHDFMHRHTNSTTRVYCPVGERTRLLPYLVRRLIENGANTSFMYQAFEEDYGQVSLTRKISGLLKQQSHLNIPRPADILDYPNSQSVDISQDSVFDHVRTDHDHRITSENEIPVIYSLVDGAAQSGELITKYSPVDGQPLSRLLKATPEDIAVAALHARKPDTPVPDTDIRIATLNRWAEAIENHQHEFIQLLIQEAGKTYQDALDEIREACDFCRFYALEASRKLCGNQSDTRPGVTGEVNELHYKGKGVAVCISPWNFPLAIFTGQIAAAWAGGNRVIAKPAHQTSLIAHKAISLAHHAGIDPHHIQLLLCDGKNLLPQLMEQHAVQLVCFTGSTATAKQIQRELAEYPGAVIPMIAETGGQNVLIADSTALLDQLIPDVVNSAFYSAGQRCSALRIACIQQEIWEPFCHALKGHMATLNTGDPTLRETDIGPVIDCHALKSLNDHKQWLDEHAMPVASAPMSSEKPEKGVYFSPCAYQIPSISALTEEHFGPILHLVPYEPKELDRILDEIHGSGYGLTMGIHSRNQDWIEYITQRADIGNIYINRNMTGAKVSSQPFGGHGLSGTGPKAGGPNYLMAMVNEYTVTTNITAWGGNPELLG